MGKLEGKVSIVTGGASGIGSATVRLFAAEGSRVVIADVLDDKGKELAHEFGDRAMYLHTDVSREEDVKGAVERSVARFGGLDVLFNNAGFGGVGGPIDQTPTEGFDSAMAVLLRGVFLGMKYAAVEMKKKGSGVILNTASVAGLRTGFGPHVYSAAKAAVIHLTRSVAMELGESGIRVNCICPGGIATPIFGKGFGLSPEAADGTVAIMDAALANLQPIRRAGQPADIARAALWLASDDSSFVNGEALVVDGGLSNGRLWSETEAGAAMLRAVLGVPQP